MKARIFLNLALFAICLVFALFGVLKYAVYGEDIEWTGVGGLAGLAFLFISRANDLMKRRNGKT